MTDNETTAETTARELGGINENLTNINAAIAALRDEMPCRSSDPRINPASRLARLETTQESMKKEMGIVKKIGAGIASIFTAVAAWFVMKGGDN